MAFSALDSALYAHLLHDEEMGALFSDVRFVAHMLTVEETLARVQAGLGLIPAAAADQISQTLAQFEVDLPALQNSVEQSGVPVIDLVRQLRRAVGPTHGEYVHWGATTQDIMDTALVLQMRSGLDLLVHKLAHIIENLAGLADCHRDTLMAGRTHSQQALPISFGLKAAGWLAPLLRHRQRLHELRPRLLVVQLGGAAGTLAALGEQGPAVQAGVAAQLDLGLLPIPWHTQRDGLVEAASWLSLLSGSLAKMAQDLILLAQSEVGEVRESGDPARGGSSTMPQKANPIASELIIATARSNASLLSALHQAQIQEHERATHGWQMEWLNLPPMFGLTATALNKAILVSDELVVDAARMQENVERSLGLMMAEAINFALAEHMGRAEAKALIRQGCETVYRERRHLVDVMQELTAVPLDWAPLRDERTYLGAAHRFIDQVLGQV